MISFQNESFSLIVKKHLVISIGTKTPSIKMETKMESDVPNRIQGEIFPPKPILFGVLNITSDSFSDGGKYLREDLALAKAKSLIEEGADVIDIGAQSSNVKAEPISEKVEWDRMKEIISELKKEKVAISVDTFRPYVIRKVLETGVDYINNIRGFVDPESLDLLKEINDKHTKFVAMFSQDHSIKASELSDLKPETVVPLALEFFRERTKFFETLGLADRLILDPGMGFFLSPDYKVSFAVLSKITEILSEFPNLMVSVTKKSFLGNALGGLPVEDRIIPTAISETYLWSKGVPMIRTHSPKTFLLAMRTWEMSHGVYSPQRGLQE
ncbi:dihydropteroate synthase [Leptospira selangorensis]|uniref:Dihydropteroate synthase n=2 Tax=Leptospira selangorensis TaxID=2484982 RepID=A0A5F2BZ39_9LEPT|nr:dihydropteroate synthase [Leptospira selangorensis]TGM18066.1 dihydropteroate synthase [Leptospira selangorensis]